MKDPVSNYGPYYKSVKGCGIWFGDDGSSRRQSISIRAKTLKEVGFRIVRNK